jgi:hypothetical protein
MKSMMIAGVLVALSHGFAFAQAMTCADYLKADQQMKAQMGGGSTSTGNAQMDAQAAEMDKKINDYCAKNPTASLEKAMTEALK